ncbi:MAG: hypothetical protein RLZZ188_3197, partial [Verrucomicrobiota bacterium]
VPSFRLPFPHFAVAAERRPYRTNAHSGPYPAVDPGTVDPTSHRTIGYAVPGGPHRGSRDQAKRLFLLCRGGRRTK